MAAEMYSYWLVFKLPMCIYTNIIDDESEFTNIDIFQYSSSYLQTIQNTRDISFRTNYKGSS
jgi:hypothetical protein